MTRSLLVALSSFLIAGCASTAALETPPNGATLELENRTHEDLAVSVWGRSEGIVRSGTRVRLHHLVAGDANVEARSTIGGPGAFVVRAQLVLDAGAIKLWSIAPDAAGGEPLPVVPRLGALKVMNPSSKDVSVLINGVRAGRIFAGAERRFDDVPAGVARVSVRPDDGTADQTIELAIVADTEATWRFEQLGAELVIDNATDEAIEITVDGEARVRVGAGETWTSLESPGVRLLQARSEPSRRPYEALLELTTAAPVVWKVEGGQSALIIENDSGEALTVQVPGREVATLLPKKWVRFDDLPTGATTINARGEATRGAYAAQLELLPAQVTTWVVGAVAGSIRVENRTPRAVTIYTDIGGKEVERGSVQPGSVALIRDLPRSNIHLSAIANGVAKRIATTVDLSETPAATWIVTAVTGAVRVVNERGEAMDVFVDALRVGEVPANGERTFTGVEIGERLVECVGQTSGAPNRERLSVNEEVLVTTTVSDVTAWISVTNTTGETVVTRGVLADEVAELPDGSSIRFRVRAGASRLSVLGRDSGLVYGRALDVKAGETASWSIALDPGSLVIWSQLDETVALTIDDRAQGTLAPDDRMAITDLSAGRHRIQLVGLRTGIVRAQDANVAPGGETKMTFAMAQSVLLVENRSQEEVEVTVDGARFGNAPGGALHAFGNVAPGKREVELYFATSHRTQRVTLDIREGQRARIVAEAPMGTLVVDNRSQQDVRITVDGKAVAIVPADAGPTLVSAPAGSRHIRIERIRDRSELGFELVVRADSAIHLPVPPRNVRLVVVNRTDEVLTLFAGERRIAEMAPRSSEMFEALPDGDQRLFAKDAEGRVTHEEQRRLHPGETATWVLAAP